MQRVQARGPEGIRLKLKADRVVATTYSRVVARVPKDLFGEVEEEEEKQPSNYNVGNSMSFIQANLNGRLGLLRDDAHRSCPLRSALVGGEGSYSSVVRPAGFDVYFCARSTSPRSGNHPLLWRRASFGGERKKSYKTSNTTVETTTTTTTNNHKKTFIHTPLQPAWFAKD